MRQITIIGVDAHGNLKWDPEGGNDKARRNEDVHWRVKDPTGNVVGINDIHWKRDLQPPDPHNRDIFSSNPPEPQGSDPVAKHWKGIVNKRANDTDVYFYSITWEDKNGVQHPVDPKIAVNPDSPITHFLNLRKSDWVTLGIGLAVGMLGFFSIKLLLDQKRERDIFKK